MIGKHNIPLLLAKLCSWQLGYLPVDRSGHNRCDLVGLPTTQYRLLSPQLSKHVRVYSQRILIQLELRSSGASTILVDGRY